MRLVPNPWGGSWFSYLSAVLIGLFRLTGLVIAIHRGAWVVALVWGALLVGTLIMLARDLLKAVRRKS